MAIRNPPPATLPFVYRASNEGEQRAMMLFLASLFLIVAAVLGLLGYAELVRAKHWMRFVLPTLLVAGLWLILWLLVANYRRATAVWRVDEYGIERTIGRRCDLADFDNLTRLALRPQGAVIEAEQGPALALPQPVADILRQTRVVAALAAGIDPAIQSAGYWQVRARSAPGLLRIAGGLTLLVASTFHLWDAGHALKLITTGRRFFGRSLVLARTGFKRSADDFATVPWGEIETLEADASGLLIRVAGGQKFRVSPYADNYLPLLAYLNDKFADRGLHVPHDDAWPQET